MRLMVSYVDLPSVHPLSFTSPLLRVSTSHSQKELGTRRALSLRYTLCLIRSTPSFYHVLRSGSRLRSGREVKKITFEELGPSKDLGPHDESRVKLDKNAMKDHIEVHTVRKGALYWTSVDRDLGQQS